MPTTTTNVANGKCSVVSRKAENKLGLNLVVHTKNFAPLTRAENSKSQSNLCAFFLLLSSRIICVLCVSRRSRWRRKRRREGEWWESIEFGWQLVASTLRMRNISPQQQWQSVQQWNWREGVGFSGGKLLLNFTDFYDFQEVFFFSVVCITTKFSLQAAFAFQFNWTFSIFFYFFIVSLELIKRAQTETLWVRTHTHRLTAVSVVYFQFGWNRNLGAFFSHEGK